MSDQALFVTLFAIGLLLAFLAARKPRLKMPPSKAFTCRRCKTTTLHDARTANAWRAGKTAFFCRSCHAAWLQDRPSQARDSAQLRETDAGGSGCLGAVAVCALLPLGGWLIWVYA